MLKYLLKHINANILIYLYSLKDYTMAKMQDIEKERQGRKCPKHKNPWNTDHVVRLHEEEVEDWAESTLVMGGMW